MDDKSTRDAAKTISVPEAGRAIFRPLKGC